MLRVCVCVEMMGIGVQETEYFFLKTTQLYEMIVVRHGLMVVGLPFSGKSSSLKVLGDALGELAEKGLNDENKVKTVHVNDATGHFLKLIVNEAHRNPRNPHGQVSLVSLVVEGTQELSDGVSEIIGLRLKHEATRLRRARASEYVSE